MSLVGDLTETYYSVGILVTSVPFGLIMLWYGAVDQSNRWWAWLATVGCALLAASQLVDSFPMLIAGGALTWAGISAVADLTRRANWRSLDVDEDESAE